MKRFRGCWKKKKMKRKTENWNAFKQNRKKSSQNYKEMNHTFQKLRKFQGIQKMKKHGRPLKEEDMCKENFE